MEDLERYTKDFINPTIEDFKNNPNSIRHAFLACVATYHGIDYLAWPDKPAALRQRFRENRDFKRVDNIAHAFKHVATSKRSDKGLKMSDVTLDPTDRGANLLGVVNKARDFLLAAGAQLNRENRGKGFRSAADQLYSQDVPGLGLSSG